MPGVQVSGIGYELGEDLIDNKRVSEIVNASVRRTLGRNSTEEEEKNLFTDADWISERTGIHGRYLARPETATSDLAAKAVLKAIERSDRKVQDCGFVLVATVTPDYFFSPPTAALVQKKIGFQPRNGSKLNQIIGADMSLACSSFATALRFGYSLIASGECEFGVVVGADKMSTAANPADRSFYVLLGDAAAAVALQAVSEKENAFLTQGKSFFSYLDGEGWDKIIALLGGSRNPLTFGVMEEMSRNQLRRPDKLWQDGVTVLKEIGNLVYSNSKPEGTIIGDALANSGIGLSELDFVFLHQASGRIVAPIKRRIQKAPGFKGNIFNTYARFANTTSASLPLGMAVAYEEEKLKKGDNILGCVFGGGYSAGTAFFRWSI